VDEYAEHGHADDGCGKRQRKRPAEDGKQPVDHVHAAHDEIGIGDPHHVDYAEDQVQSEGEQRQDAREQQAIDRRLEQEDVHPRYSPI